YALHRYGLWMQNAIKKIKHGRKIGKKIQAVKIIQQKWLEHFYRPNSIYAMELAQHYQLLWAVREKMRQKQWSSPPRHFTNYCEAMT
ncbi:41861_t:CDS:2, partial [Gigaspora margarita]